MEQSNLSAIGFKPQIHKRSRQTPTTQTHSDHQAVPSSASHTSSTVITAPPAAWLPAMMSPP